MAAPLKLSLAKRSPAGYAIVSLKGVAMGAADLIPGVSGGTIALILGIYEELIQSIKMLGRAPFWRSLLRLDLRGAFESINGWFLASLIAGILFAIATLARGLYYLTHTYPVMLASFFFGLVAASVWLVAQRVDRWRARSLLGFAGGAAIAFTVVGLTPAETPDAAWFLFLSGAIGACAMILPGISGAFILLLLGKYEFVLGAVNRGDIAPLAIIVAGGLVGLVSLAQLLGWLFRRYPNFTLAVLAGFMLGSLRKLWPWKEADALAPEELATNVLPELFVAGSLNSEVLFGAMWALVGAALVLVLAGLERRTTRRGDA
jgi:putative membrane protein